MVDVGFDAATGKRRQQGRSGFATKAEAEKALRDLLTSIEYGTYVESTPTTLKEYLDGWLQTSKACIRETTWHSYALSVKRVNSQLGAVKLQALTPLQIETCYTRLMSSGGRRGRPLSAKTVRNVHIVLHRALSDAERLGLVPRNAAHAAKGPIAQRADMVTWTSEELAAFLDHVRSDRLYAAYVLLATTGMRRGEVLGLRWSDVDLQHGRPSISQTITTMYDAVLIGPTKSNRSRRNVSLDPESVSVLKAHRRAQAQERLAAGELWDPEPGLVFCQEDGTHLHPDRFTDAFQRDVRDAGLPKLRGPHGLRHTWATLALQSGVHPKVVSDRLGHSTIAVTIDTYSHVAPSLDADAANVVAATIFGPRSKQPVGS
jgi:integrase